MSGVCTANLGVLWLAEAAELLRLTSGSNGRLGIGGVPCESILSDNDGLPRAVTYPVSFVPVLVLILSLPRWLEASDSLRIRATSMFSAIASSVSFSSCSARVGTTGDSAVATRRADCSRSRSV